MTYVYTLCRREPVYHLAGWAWELFVTGFIMQCTNYMKKLLFTLGICLFVMSSVAQEDLRKEILAFSDTTAMMVKNGRRLMLDKIRAEDHQGAVKTLDYLMQHVDKRHVILYPAEELLFSLATRNFQLFTYVVANFNNLLEGRFIHTGYDGFTDEIQKYLADEMRLVVEDLNNATLRTPDREMINLYIRYFTQEDPMDVNKSVKAYLKAYPQTEYKGFLTMLKNMTTPGQFSFTLGYGNEFLSGNIADQFESRLHFMNMEVEVFVDQTYVSLFMGGNIDKLYAQTDMPVKKKDAIHTSDRPVSSLKYGLKYGRIVYRNRTIKLYPYLSIGGYEMNSQSKDIPKDTTTPKNNLTGAFFTGIGSSCDIKVVSWKSKNSYAMGSHVFVRPSLGYDYFLTGKEIATGQNLYFSVSLGWAIQ